MSTYTDLRAAASPALRDWIDAHTAVVRWAIDGAEVAKPEYWASLGGGLRDQAILIPWLNKYARTVADTRALMAGLTAARLIRGDTPITERLLERVAQDLGFTPVASEIAPTIAPTGWQVAKVGDQIKAYNNGSEVGAVSYLEGDITWSPSTPRAPDQTIKLPVWVIASMLTKLNEATPGAPVPIEKAKKGDKVRVTYAGERVTAKVVRVKPGWVTVDLSGQHSDPDVEWVDIYVPKLPAGWRIDRVGDRVTAYKDEALIGQVAHIGGHVEWSPSTPRARNSDINLPKEVIAAMMAAILYDRERP